MNELLPTEPHLQASFNSTTENTGIDCLLIFYVISHNFGTAFSVMTTSTE